MDTTTLEHEMLNCPDCQLQTLQQQQQQQQQAQQNQGNEKHEHASIPTKEMGQSSQSTRNAGSFIPQNIGDSRVHLSGGPGNSESAKEQQNLQYRAPSSVSSHYSSNPCGVQNVPMTSNLIPAAASVPSSSTASAEMYTSGSLTPLPIEGCDISGYCATCAVLDLPSNDKYYRPSLSRHSVFPPMFYSQPPPIPGFSPVPDCNPWTNSNEYAAYSYTSAYQQPQQSTSTDYYGNCSVPLSSQSHAEGTSQMMNSCSFSFPSTSTTNAVSSEEHKKVTKEPEKPHFVDPPADNEDDGSAVPIIISSSSEDTSDSGSYISQREVIVEDDDDNVGDGSVSMSICNMVRNHRCVVCQITIMADCSSPQLANILENIHEDITAEDLDITVSSGDIEIGGIEDEVRDFQQPKKSAACQISFTRLSYLLNVPVQVFLSVNDYELEDPGQTHPPDPNTHFAPLCAKCGKLAGTVDMLEKQLRSNCLALKQILQAQAGPVVCDKSVGSPAVTAFVKVSTEKSELPSISRHSVSVVTQTEPEELSQCLMTLQPPTPKSPTCKHRLKVSHRMEEVPSPKNLINFRDIRLEYAAANESVNNNTQEEMMVKCFQAAERSMESLTNLTGGPNPQLITVSDPFQCTDKELEVILPVPESTSANPAQVSDPLWLPSFDIDKRRDFLCEECGTILGCWRTFDIHCKRHHNQLRYQCGDCLKCFATEAALKIHVRSHTGEKPFECSSCGKGFSTKSNLNAHWEFCKAQCGNPSSGKSVLADLEYNTAQNNDKFKCENCGISFRLKERFDSHMKKGCGANAFSCTRCQRKFSKKSELKVHLLTHDGKKPFVCDICGLSFTTRGNQVAHSRTHSEQRRFKCNICDKGFNRRQALQLHMNRHNGLKPFTCEFCSRSFSDPSNLQSHKKIHEKA